MKKVTPADYLNLYYFLVEFETSSRAASEFKLESHLPHFVTEYGLLIFFEQRAQWVLRILLCFQIQLPAVVRM